MLRACARHASSPVQWCIVLQEQCCTAELKAIPKPQNPGCAGTKEQIQAVIDAELIPPLVAMLGEAEFDIKKEAAWAISNATSGGRRVPQTLNP